MTEADPFPSGGIEVDGVLFDMDGTLVDSTAVVERLWGGFATRYGVDLAVLLRYSHGRRTGDTISRFLPAGHDPAAVTAEFERRELVETDGIVEIPGARRLLGSLAGARAAIVTSAPRALAEARLSAAGLLAPAVLVCAEDVDRGKPDPQGYRTAARLLSVAPERCLVVEDAEAGIRAGLAAGAHLLVVGAHCSQSTGDLPGVPDLEAVTGTVIGNRIDLRWKGHEN